MAPVFNHTCSLGAPRGSELYSSFRADMGLPLIQTVKYHTKIETNMLDPLTHYKMKPELGPQDHPGALQKSKIATHKKLSKTC